MFLTRIKTLNVSLMPNFIFLSFLQDTEHSIFFKIFFYMDHL